MGVVVILARLAIFLNRLWFGLLSLPGFSLLDQLLYGVPASATASLEDIPQSFAEASSTSPPSTAWSHSFITTNGIRLHIVSAGPQDAPLMLCVHGFPECWYSWRHQLVEFSSEYRVVAVDMRGYNTSAKPARRTDYAVNNLVNDLKGIITGLGYQKCTLVAHDWGGGVAWNALYSIPQHLERVIIMNAPHPVNIVHALANNEEQIKASWYIFAFQIPFFPEIMVRKIIPSLFYDSLKNPLDFTTQDNNEYIRSMSQPGSPTASINWYRNMLAPSALPPRGAKISIPTLLIWGQDDDALLQSLTIGTERHFSSPNLFSLKLVPSASHWVAQDQPELVTHFMRAFLNKKIA